VAVERGQQKLSELVINNNNNNNNNNTPAVVQDLQKMLAHNVEIAANQKRINKIQKKAAQSMEQFRGDGGDGDDDGALTYMMENQLEAAKARMDNYAFKNARLREEILLLRKMCNERIMNLWNETQSLRFKQKDKERALRHKEAALEKTQGVLEARDQRISEQQRTQQDKFVFFNSQVRLYRSVSERYKEELETLKRAMQAQTAQAGQQMSRTQDLCAQRVEQYRKMYEQSLKLLQELRAKAAETPAVTDKINQLQGNLTQAVTNGGSDAQVMGAFARVGQNMSSLEQSIQGSNNAAEDMMWYNNNATGNYASV
jgi:translation initiation factor 1 (eIF-1/SUI1)